MRHGATPPLSGQCAFLKSRLRPATLQRGAGAPEFIVLSVQEFCQLLLKLLIA